jgi:hypothetical protein
MEYLRVIETIEAPIGEVWGVIAGFGALRTWMEAVESCSLEGCGIGAVRTVRVMGALTRERLTSCDADAYRLGYELLDPTILPARGITSEMSLRPLGAASCEMTWASCAEEILSQEDLIAIVQPFYQGSIAGLRRSLLRS